MNHLIGFMIFWVGVGILIALIFPKSFFMVLVAALCLIVGYNLFCSCK